MAALQKKKGKKPWVERGRLGGEGCDWYKCSRLCELSLCSLGEAPATERAPRMASAHWLSSEGLEKKNLGQETRQEPSPTRPLRRNHGPPGHQAATVAAARKWAAEAVPESAFPLARLSDSPQPVLLILGGRYSPVFQESLVCTVLESDLWPANTFVGKPLGREALTGNSN